MQQQNYHESAPKKPQGSARRRKLGWLVLACCVLILIAGGAMLAWDVYGATNTAGYYAALRGADAQKQAQTPADIAFSTEKTTDIQQAFALMDGDSDLTQEQQSALEAEATARREGFSEDDRKYLETMADKRQNALTLENKGTAAVSGMNFSPLLQQNKDTVAWLQIGDTVIDYPVVQGEDNEFYINHRFDGAYSKAGTVFMDYRNSAQLQDQNTILYGHHMGNGTMFCSLKEYKKQAYFDQYPTLMLYTPQGDYRVELFAGYVTPIRDTALPCFYMNYENDEAFTAYIAEAKRRSTFESPVEVTPQDRIITLCTCTYEVYNARYVLQGKLVPVTADAA